MREDLTKFDSGCPASRTVYDAAEIPEYEWPPITIKAPWHPRQYHDVAVCERSTLCDGATALSELKIGVVSHSRAGGNPDRGTGFPPARE